MVNAPGEGMEALFQGQKGDKGETGEQGQGISVSARRAVIYLFVLTLLLAGANLLWTGHEVNASRAAQALVQAQQQRQGEVIGRKLCLTLGKLAALTPPTRADVKKGAPYPPSFIYEDRLHVALSELGADIGCIARRG